MVRIDRVVMMCSIESNTPGVNTQALKMILSSMILLLPLLLLLLLLLVVSEDDDSDDEDWRGDGSDDRMDSWWSIWWLYLNTFNKSCAELYKFSAA